MSRVETVRVVRTAINPLLWLVGLVTPLALVGMVLIADIWIRIALLTLAFLPVVFTIFAYIVYMFRDPDRLQSEEFRLRQSALQMLYRSGSATEVVDAVNDIVRAESSRAGFDDGGGR